MRKEDIVEIFARLGYKSNIKIMLRSALSNVIVAGNDKHNSENGKNRTTKHRNSKRESKYLKNVASSKFIKKVITRRRFLENSNDYNGSNPYERLIEDGFTQNDIEKAIYMVNKDTKFYALLSNNRIKLSIIRRVI